MTKRRNLVGPPVQGNDFYDREPDQRRIWEYLETDNLLLLAPRRVGKTSLMYRLQDTAEIHTFQATYLSVADITTESQFVERLFQAVHKIDAAQSTLRGLAENLKGFLKFFAPKKIELGPLSLEFTLEASTEWAKLGTLLAESLDRLPNRWLLMVDELPLFVLSLLNQDPSGVRARNFLNWFRQVRQGPDGAQNVRWLLAGSIGLDTVARMHGLVGTINDLHLVSLGAFEDTIADRFLQELAQSYAVTFPPEARARALERIGWPIPFFLQLLFSKLRDHCSEQRCEVTAALVDECFEDLLRPANRSYFDYWRERLHDELDAPNALAAMSLLTAIAGPEQGASSNILRQVLSKHVSDPEERMKSLRFLLEVLETDGYIVRSEQLYHFRSPLLRAFWLRRNDV